MKRIIAIVLVVGAMTAGSVLAQSPAPALPSGAPAAPRPAIEIPAEKKILLSQALDAVQTAIASCTAQGATSSVAVVDMNGNIKAMLSSDGAANNSFEYVRTKAYTVLKKGMSSGAYGKSLGPVKRGDIFEGDPSLTQYSGALPITKDGEIIGAISVSSSSPRADEVCATAGLAKIHF